MDQLLNEFEPVSADQWLAQLEHDLAGKPIDSLVSRPEPDLSLTAYHHRETQQTALVKTNYTKQNNNWKIRQAYCDKHTNNAEILADLNNGIEALGLALSSNEPINSLTANVLFEHIHADFSFVDKTTACQFTPPVNAVLNFDVLGLNAKKGFEVYSLHDYLDFYRAHSASKTIWISGSCYGEAGASSVQELAFTLCHLNEYLHELRNQGETLETLNKKITIELSVNENYFVNIAKFRVIQHLVRLVFKGYDATYQVLPVEIHAQTNLRHLAANDHNNNPLRETTQAMSAVIGGCDVLTIRYDQIGSPIDQERSRRIAKNIQLILKEEAYLNQVVDPSHGSYAIESLSNQLLEKAWALFVEMEDAGGLIKNLKSNAIQTRIDANKMELISDLESNKRTFLGVNKHPNATEKWLDTRAGIQPDSTGDFKALHPFKLENYYTKSVKTNGSN